MTPDALIARARVVLAQFAVEGSGVELEPYGNGHIHDSFAAKLRSAHGERRLLLQRFNRRVFTDPQGVMANIAAVTEHLRRRLAAEGANADGREALRLIASRTGGWLVTDGDGEVWRAYDFIARSVARDRPTRPDEARAAARGFARFLRLLDGAPVLIETIPHFHETPQSLTALADAVRRDPQNRAAGAGAELAQIERQSPLVHAFTARRDAGELARRAVHNDTKLNNLLFDADTGRELCVIDLDTVMPGLALYDFGDLVRTLASATPEDEPDPSRVAARPEYVLAAAQGWIEGSADSLLPLERELLVRAARLLSFECGIRFLTDYVDGDRYFKTSRPGQNLDRARAQLALERSLAEQEEPLQRSIETLAVDGAGSSE